MSLAISGLLLSQIDLLYPFYQNENIALTMNDSYEPSLEDQCTEDDGGIAIM